ncbi:MAG: hypothetical protein ACRC14_04740 [Paracoccaceae bacterium]
MLKPDDLKAMTPEARTQMFESLATEFYGTERHGEMVARDFGLSRNTIINWKRGHTVPLAVIYTLDAWLKTPQFATTIIGDWASIAPDLSKIAYGLSQVCGKLASIGRRMPSGFASSPAAAPDGAAASPDAPSDIDASD